MQELRSYVLSVVCTALICAILKRFIQDPLLNNLLHIMCGLFLTLVVIRPLANLDLGQITWVPTAYIQEGESAIQTGKEMAQSAQADIIKEHVEAYISDKATKLQAELTAEVFLNEENLPVSVEIRGSTSPYVKKALKTIIETDLGITEENQLWIG